jgi:hypothetical protein
MIIRTKEQLHIFMHANKLKYKYLSRKNVSIYIYIDIYNIYISRNASGIDSVHLNSVLNGCLTHIIAFNSVSFSPFSLFNPIFLTV